MVNLNRKNILTTLSLLVLILGFQNCGDSTYQNIDTIQDTPISSILTDDTKYHEGLDFEVMSLASASSDLASEFKVSKNSDKRYNIIETSTSYNCSFENQSASEELLQITEISRISHPSMVSSTFNTCDSNSGDDVYYAIGSQSKIYLVLKDQDEDCYSGDPQKLLNQNKRVFVVDNLSINDIEGLVDSVKQDVLNESNCLTFSTTID